MLFHKQNLPVAGQTWMYSGNASNLLMDWIHLFGTNVLRSFWFPRLFLANQVFPHLQQIQNHQNNMTGSSLAGVSVNKKLMLSMSWCVNYLSLSFLLLEHHHLLSTWGNSYFNRIRLPLKDTFAPVKAAILLNLQGNRQHECVFLKYVIFILFCLAISR
jgi:hypothetical protein